MRHACSRSRHGTALVLCVAVTTVGALVMNCGGDGSTGGATGPATCQPTTVCACADNGPPDFSHEGAGVPTPTDSPDQKAVLIRANHWRTAIGLPALNANAALDTAATAHAMLMASTPTSCWPGAHYETAGCPGFTGMTPGDRVTAAGYRYGSVSEVINWESTPNQTVDGWMWTVYHREPFTDVGNIEVGYGTAVGPYNGNPNGHHNTMDLARALTATAPTQTGVAVFPPPGATLVPVAFHGDLEGPTPPVPATGQWPSGTVISLNFPSDQYTVISHALYNSFCEAVPHSYFTHANDPNLHNPRFVYFYADRPLNHGETYTVVVHATVDGADWTRRWNFHTL